MPCNARMHLQNLFTQTVSPSQGGRENMMQMQHEQLCIVDHWAQVPGSPGSSQQRPCKNPSHFESKIVEYCRRAHDGVFEFAIAVYIIPRMPQQATIYTDILRIYILHQSKQLPFSFAS